MCRFKVVSVFLSVVHASFNTSYVSVQAVDGIYAILINEFQYILCVGSRGVFTSKIIEYASFNTSYVSVQVTYHKTSICLLLCFNTSYVSVQVKRILRRQNPKEFQYILCVGSRNSTLLRYKL